MFLASEYTFKRAVCGLLITRKLQTGRTIEQLSTFSVYSTALYEMHKYRPMCAKLLLMKSLSTIHQ